MQIIKSEIKKQQQDFVDSKKIPNHIAIIMDGNRRWARKNGLPSIAGHTKGAHTLTEIVKSSIKFKIKILTVFAFSTENWNRDEDEVKKLMNLYEVFLNDQLTFMLKEKIRLNVIGDLSKCPNSLQNCFSSIIEKTKNNAVLDLVIAINYGSKDEMRRAMIKILDDYDNKKVSKEGISEKLINSYLDTKSFSDPDLFIRTSGEQRLSNFLLWQLSYAEIYITDILWPDFSEKDFLNAILEYQKRKRRFGGS
ncbi:MAG: isoprenyl transferase [Parachlamydiales bacterium]|jgi:undecaprenyl diphosphate synthase